MSLQELRWLEGEWHAVGRTTTTIEFWSQVSDGTMEGYGKGIDNVSGAQKSVESLRLVEMSGDIFYIAKTTGNEFPIPFKLKLCDSKTAVFENMAHDFPKQLKYELLDDSNLTVLVTDGGTGGFSLRFKKVVS